MSKIRGVLIWLASYPRSGNTLLRQVLWQTMGRRSFDDVPYPGFMGDWALNYEREFGSLARLREEATNVDEPILVKTHLLPQDVERAVYVVRDGRSAVTSFLEHQRVHEPQTEPTLTGLILGDHFYGGWSEHVRAWRDRPAETLVVRFADLRDGNAETLTRLAEFVGNTRAMTPWVNRCTRIATATSELAAKESALQALDAERTVQTSAAAERATAIERLTAELKRLRSEAS